MVHWGITNNNVKSNPVWIWISVFHSMAVYLEERLLGHVVILNLLIEKKCFSQQLYLLEFHQYCMEFSNTCYLLKIAIFLWLWFAFSQGIIMFNIFFYVYWPFVYTPWRKVCANHLSNFNSVVYLSVVLKQLCLFNFLVSLGAHFFF